jgi:hypothetical protein
MPQQGLLRGLLKRFLITNVCVFTEASRNFIFIFFAKKATNVKNINAHRLISLKN